MGPEYRATKCFICGEDFVDGDVKVRDHCHFTGRYRGCAHQDCNLQFAMKYSKIHVFLHNQNYDSHLIIERANELSEKNKIEVIAQNSENFITFAFKNICFKDSFSFLSSSLDKLVKLSKYEDGEKKKNVLKTSNSVREAHTFLICLLGCLDMKVHTS